jgi:hypothetical protein
MADARSVLVLDAAGAPLTSASPTWVDYRDRAGAARSPPPVPAHLGNGVWAWAPSAEDEATGTVALVDFGAGALPRRVCWPVHRPDGANQFWAFHVEDAGGALWTGAAPTVGHYDDSTGAPRTPPAPAAVSGAYLWALTPTAADVAAGIEGRIDGPTGSAQPYWGLSTEAVVVAPAPPAAPAVRDAAADIQAFLAGRILSGVSLELGRNLFRGPVRPHPSSTSPAVFVLNLGGSAPAPFLGGGRKALAEALVAVFVRGGPGEWAKGEALARAVLGDVQLRAPAGYVDWLVQEAHPVSLEVEDAGQHPLWQFTVQARYVSAPA